MTVAVEDDHLRDALFLHAHPGWTYRDLMETPESIRRLLVVIGREAELIRRQQR